MNKSKFERFMRNLRKFADEHGLLLKWRVIAKNILEIEFCTMGHIFVAKLIINKDEVTDWCEAEARIKRTVITKLSHMTKPDKTDSFMVAARGSGRTYYNRLLDSLSYKSYSSSVVPAIEKVIFNKPATIVFWSDGTKTVVKVQKGDKFNKEKGLAMAITKKALGNEGNYYDEIKKWVE